MSHVYFHRDGRNLCQWCLSRREVEVEGVLGGFTIAEADLAHELAVLMDAEREEEA